MVEFGGWEMPVEYSGISDEHMAVRTRAGLFDVSHMGQLEVAGADAVAAVQRITSNDAAKLKVGQAQYSGLMLPNGAFVDDLLVYRFAPDPSAAGRPRRSHAPRRRRAAGAAGRPPPGPGGGAGARAPGARATAGARARAPPPRGPGPRGSSARRRGSNCRSPHDERKSNF